MECGLSGTVLVLVNAEKARADSTRGRSVPVIAVSAEPWDPAWPADLPLTVPAPRLSVAERQSLWAPLLGDLAGSREITGMPLSPEQIVNVGRHAATTAPLHGEEGHLRRAGSATPRRELSRGRSVRAERRVVGDASTTSVLPPAALGEVTRMLDWARFRDEVVAMGPLHGKGGKGVGICALFSGPPGTGKTLAAARRRRRPRPGPLPGRPLRRSSTSTSARPRRTSSASSTRPRRANAVLFFDEADALFGKRTEVKDASDRYANQETAYLLQRMEEFDGITVLATNLRGNLDPAFARRLHFMVAFPDPDQPTRRRLWSTTSTGSPIDADDPVDVEWLSTSVELAGGDIRNMVLSVRVRRRRRGQRRRHAPRRGRGTPRAHQARSPTTGRALAASETARQTSAFGHG